MIAQGKTQLAPITSVANLDLIEREATLLALEGRIYVFTGPMERAIEFFQQSLLLREQRGMPQAIVPSLTYLGIVYLCKTEFNRSGQKDQAQVCGPICGHMELFRRNICRGCGKQCGGKISYWMNTAGIWDEIPGPFIVRTGYVKTNGQISHSLWTFTSLRIHFCK